MSAGLGLRVLTFAACLSFASHAKAEELISVEPEASDSTLDSKAGGAAKASSPSLAPRVERGLEDSRSFRVVGALSGDRHGGFGSRLTAVFPWRYFLSSEISGLYTREAQKKASSSETMAVEAALVARFSNPMLVTPFIGAGPGYEHWRHEKDGEVYDEGGSPVGVAFWGLDLALTQHFGFTISRRQVRSWGKMPQAGVESLGDEPKTRLADSIAFRVLF